MKNCTNEADDLFSDYPILLHGNSLIQKENIASFLQQMTSIDDKFNSSDTNSHGFN